MQPDRIFIAGGVDALPDRILIGFTEDQKPVKIVRKDLARHILFRGQTGAGKSRTLVLFLTYLLSCGYRCIFLDPIGAPIYDMILDWYAYLGREAYAKNKKTFAWFTEKLIPNIMFWDLSNGNHNIRHNPLAPCKYINEDLNKVLSRLIRFFNVLFADEAGQNGLSLQLQRRTNLLNLCILLSTTQTPLKDALFFVYNKDFRNKIISQAEQRMNALNMSQDQAYNPILGAITHYRYLEDAFPGPRYSEVVNSVITGLSIFFENESVCNLLMSGENNVDISEIFNTQSLIIRTPLCDLATRKLLFQYLYTIFLDLADQRQPGCDVLYLGSDESALVMNSMLADYITRLRNKNTFLIMSHQSVSQMLTPEGEKIAKTIAEMSKIQFQFRHSYDEAKHVIGMFSPRGKTINRLEVTTTIQRNNTESLSSSVGSNTSQQNGIGLGRGTGEQISQTFTKSYSMTESQSQSQSISKQWSDSEADSQTFSIQVAKSFSFQQSASNGMTLLRGDQLSFILGEGRSLAKITTETGTVTLSETESKSETTSESQGTSESTGTSETYSGSTGCGSSVGYNFALSNGGSVIDITEGSSINPDIGFAAPAHVSQTYNNFSSTSKSHADQKTKAWNTLKGISNSLSKATCRGRAVGKGDGLSIGLSTQEAISMGKQFSEAESLMLGYARAIQDSLGHTKSFGKTTTQSFGVGESQGSVLGRSFQEANAFANALAKSITTNITQNKTTGTGQSLSKSFSQGTGESISLSWKLIYYSIEEEKELLLQEISSLQSRYFYLSFDNKPPIKVLSDTCINFRRYTHYGVLDFSKLLREYYYNLPKDKNVKLLGDQPIPEKQESEQAKEAPNNQEHEEFSHFFSPIDDNPTD